MSPQHANSNSTKLLQIPHEKTSSSYLSTNTRTKKLLTRKPACHIMLLPIRLHIHMWVVYLHMFHADIQLKAYMLSNFHQTNHQSTYKNYQTMSFSASCALCQMVNNSNSRNYKAMKLSRLVNRFDRIRQDNFSFLGIRKGSVILCFTIEQ